MWMDHFRFLKGKFLLPFYSIQIGRINGIGWYNRDRKSPYNSIYFTHFHFIPPSINLPKQGTYLKFHPTSTTNPKITVRIRSQMNLTKKHLMGRTCYQGGDEIDMSIK